MEYVVGGVAALISGNVTPNRPKLIRRAVTPVKHQPSPNVTPKSEFVDDRSLFLSPTLQKKKAIIKKSPKRIFQDSAPNEISGNDCPTELKTKRVKKFLEKDFGTSEDNSLPVERSPCNVKSKQRNLHEEKQKVTLETKSQKLDRNVLVDSVNTDQNERIQKRCNLDIHTEKTQKKQHKKLKSVSKGENMDGDQILNTSKKIKQKPQPKTKIKKKLKKSEEEKYFVNPNAITTKDSDSEHNSDNECESETEKTNKGLLYSEAQNDSSSEDDTQYKLKQNQSIPKEPEKHNKEELDRTIFIGNVPFSKKCKKEIKKIFNKYGKIESVRIRTVPVQDPWTTPKSAVINNQLHPDRSTVNVYLKFSDAASVEQALCENNTVLNSYHLRVSRSEAAEYDPRCAVFVGNVPFALEEDALRAKFAACGEVHSVRLVRDRKTNAGKGFGYVNFTSKDAVELALAMSDEELTIKNRILRVKRCTNRPRASGSDATGDRGRQQQGGAQRRIANKRKALEASEDQNQDVSTEQQLHQDEPKNKKMRQPFVGVIADRRKKRGGFSGSGRGTVRGGFSGSGRGTGRGGNRRGRDGGRQRGARSGP